MSKSNKLFCVLVSGKAEFRDDFISGLLDIEKSKNIQYMSNSWQLQKTSNIGVAKIWKTKRGAEKGLKYKIDDANRRIERNSNYYWGLRPIEFRFEIVEIDKNKWNEHIESLITRERNKLNSKISSLEKKKLK